MDEKKYFIGIYGDAHNTTLKIFSENGELISTGKAGVANIHFSIKHSWDVIQEAFCMALQEANIACDESKFYAGIGIKNTELVEAVSEFLKQNELFEQIKIASDAYVLCSGSHEESAAVIIADEGLVGNLIFNNTLVKVGGWGFPHADKGSIPWVGLEAVRLTLQWIDGYIESSPLISDVYDFFDKDVNRIVGWAMQSRDKPHEYTRIAEIVFKNLKKDDCAEKILKEVAGEISKIYEQLKLKTEQAGLPCVVVSPMLQYMADYLSPEILQNLISPFGDGVDGALKLIRDSFDDEK